MHDGWALWGKAKVSHDGLHVTSMCRGGNVSKELRFGGAGSSDRLCPSCVGDGAAT